MALLDYLKSTPSALTNPLGLALSPFKKPDTSTSQLDALRAQNAPAKVAQQQAYKTSLMSGTPSATSPTSPARSAFVDRVASTTPPPSQTSGGFQSTLAANDPAAIGGALMLNKVASSQTNAPPQQTLPPGPAPMKQDLPGADAAYKDAYTQYIQSLAPGKDSQAAKQKYLDFIQQRDLGLQEISDKPIPLRFVTGQQESLQKLSGIEANRLQGDVQLAQEQEQATQAQDLARLNYEKSLLDQQTAANKPIEVGGSLVNPTTGQVIYKGSSTAQPTASIQEYEYAKANGYTGSFTDYQNEDANRKNTLSSMGMGESSPLVSAIISNPELFNQLTATDKAKVIPALNALGFTSFGKPLSDTAIKDITQTETAIEQLNGLKQTIKDNLQYVGPISGLQALNPYSKARQVQADIDRVKQSVGKALEGGVLRKEDEEKYKKILATITDTPETAEYKLNQIIASLQANVETYKANQAGAGRNVPQASAATNDFSW